VNQILKTVEMNHDLDKAKKAKVEAVLLARHTFHNISRELVSLKEQLSAEDAAAIKTKLKALSESLTMKNSTSDQIQQAIGEVESVSKDPIAKAIAERRKSEAASESKA
jgi:molecular chaperone DnaK (HSP70)